MRGQARGRKGTCLRLTDSGRAVVVVDERLLDADSFCCSFGEEMAGIFGY